MNEELLPCPFCGAGNTEIRENGKVWSGMGYTRPTSTSVFHHCKPTAGQPSRAIERVGRDRASAIAAWNQRAISAPQAPAAPSTHAGLLAAAAHIQAKAQAHLDERGSYDPDTGAVEMSDSNQEHFNTLDELAEEIRMMAEKAAPTSCDKPPAGWTCSRAPGHDGPCAAAPAAPAVDESFEDLISNWAHGDALDAARWRELLRFVGGHYSPTQGVWFSVTHLKAFPGTDITDGRVEDHFTKAVDAAITERAAKESP